MIGEREYPNRQENLFEEHEGGGRYALRERGRKMKNWMGQNRGTMAMTLVGTALGGVVLWLAFGGGRSHEVRDRVSRKAGRAMHRFRERIEDRVEEPRGGLLGKYFGAARGGRLERGYGGEEGGGNFFGTAVKAIAAIALVEGIRRGIRRSGWKSV